jgi:hypothetical protein
MQIIFSKVAGYNRRRAKVKFTKAKAFSNNLIERWSLRRISIRDNFNGGGLLFCSRVP